MRKFYTSVLALFLGLCLGFTVNGQSISGTVIDETNLPLPQVSVLVKGTSKGTATDFDGRYTITGLEAGEVTIEFSFIGYTTTTRTVTLKAGENTVVDLTMDPEATDLDEVVVVGYGVQRKRELTSSVVKLGSQELNDMPTPSFETAIQGKAPGVQVITGSGLAGSGSLVRIRGVASISAGGDPLYVVDGIPITQDYFIKGNSGAMNNNPLATLNPNDIESVEILKDAAATGIYGSRGSNGVILITTKRGKKSGLHFSYSARLGTSNPTALPEMLNKEEYLQMYEEAWVNDGNIGTPVLPGGVSWEEAQAFEGTDWVDQTVATGFKQNHDFSVSKGAEKYNFYAGLSYNDNESFLVGNRFRRLSLRLNGDVNLTDDLLLSISSSFAQGVNDRVDAAWSGGLGAAMSTALPIYPIYDAEGDYFIGGTNPVRVQDLKQWRNTENRTINNAALTYRASEKLTFRGSASLDYMKINEDIYEPQELINSDHAGVSKRIPTEIINYNGSLTAQYNLSQNTLHNWDFLVGTEAQRSYSRSSYAEVIDATDPFWEDKAMRDSVDFIFNDPANEFTFVSFFGRVNYNLAGKYFAQVNFRADGSSKFGPNNRFGYFPAISFGWIITEEEWLRDNNTVSFLKLKTGYGLTGNAAIPPNQWRANNVKNVNGYNGSPYYYPTIIENPNLRWESSYTFDAALEFGLFDDRIHGELGYYYKDTRDVFLQVQVPQASGFANLWDNVGGIYNTGVEFNVTTRNTVGDFKWTTDFNIARNYNEITSIGGYSEDAVSGGTNDTRTIVGQPVGTNFLVRFSHVDKETGAPVYLDINGNETYTWDPVNRVTVGNVLPDAVGGITNSFSYKNWDLSVLFVFTIGGNIYDSSSKRQLSMVSDWNMTRHVYDRWTQPGDDARYPRLTLDPANHGSTTPWINTDLWLHDASYMRLRNVTLGYSIPTDKVRRWGLQSIRLSALATNILTFTKFPGVDPEIARDFENPTDRNMSPNITYLTPPQEKTFIFGLEVQF